MFCGLTHALIYVFIIEVLVVCKINGVLVMESDLLWLLWHPAYNSDNMTVMQSLPCS